ncbi:MAG: UbiA family prenyltransferase [Verrucomicrobiota bacterium]|nr:UbiA family prenyltransferase [Verrucomicrobiota bacterium]
MFRSWLQLLRAPNLFTVPGDPIAGFLLVNLGMLDGRAALAVLAAVCFYASGLLMNDLFDLEVDRRERPGRPLPSGQVSPRAVWVVMTALAVSGVLTLSVVAAERGALLGLTLLLVIGLYNGWSKHIPVLGAINMGLCRAMSVLIGAAAALSHTLPTRGPAINAAAITLLYFAAITHLARYETGEQAPVHARLSPILAALIGLALVIYGTGPIFKAPAATTYAVGCLFVVSEAGRLFGRTPAPIPPVIGGLIRCHLIFQAAFGLAFAHVPETHLVAVALLLLLPVSHVVGKRFYGS